MTEEQIMLAGKIYHPFVEELTILRAKAHKLSRQSLQSDTQDYRGGFDKVQTRIVLVKQSIQYVQRQRTTVCLKSFAIRVYDIATNHFCDCTNK